MMGIGAERSEPAAALGPRQPVGHESWPSATSKRPSRKPRLAYLRPASASDRAHICAHKSRSSLV
jgi:hypothetical protein